MTKWSIFEVHGIRTLDHIWRPSWSRSVQVGVEVEVCKTLYHLYCLFHCDEYSIMFDVRFITWFGKARRENCYEQLHILKDHRENCYQQLQKNIKHRDEETLQQLTEASRLACLQLKTLHEHRSSQKIGLANTWRGSTNTDDPSVELLVLYLDKKQLDRTGV